MTNYYLTWDMPHISLTLCMYTPEVLCSMALSHVKILVCGYTGKSCLLASSHSLFTSKLGIITSF